MAQSLDGDSKAKLSAHRTKIGRKTIWKTAQDMERELVMRVLSRSWMTVGMDDLEAAAKVLNINAMTYSHPYLQDTGDCLLE